MMKCIWIELALLIDGASFCFLKRVFLLWVLWWAALVDYKEYRIPNKCIVIGFIIKIIITIIEVFYGEYTLKNLCFEIFALAIMVGGGLLCRFIVKDNLGAGDIKLFVIMVLFLNWDEIWNAVLLSLILCVCMHVVLVVTGKRGWRDKIPLGPAFALGTSVFLLFES